MLGNTTKHVSLTVGFKWTPDTQNARAEVSKQEFKK